MLTNGPGTLFAICVFYLSAMCGHGTIAGAGALWNWWYGVVPNQQTAEHAALEPIEDGKTDEQARVGHGQPPDRRRRTNARAQDVDWQRVIDKQTDFIMAKIGSLLRHHFATAETSCPEFEGSPVQECPQCDAPAPCDVHSVQCPVHEHVCEAQGESHAPRSAGLVGGVPSHSCAFLVGAGAVGLLSLRHSWRSRPRGKGTSKGHNAAHQGPIRSDPVRREWPLEGESGDSPHSGTRVLGRQSRIRVVSGDPANSSTPSNASSPAKSVRADGHR